jgi:type IV pilus assembly protein PilW
MVVMMASAIARPQKGMSLIELLVAMTIGIIVTAIIISLFIYSKQNYRVNENMSRMQENARFAVSFITRDLRMAGYHPCDSGVDSRDDAVSGPNGAFDKITLRWTEYRDCDTTTSADDNEITTVYSIQDGSNGRSALFRFRDWGDAPSELLELVEGIDNLQILFGEDTDDDEAPNYYVDAASVANLADVTSIRFVLTAQTLETNISTDGDRISRDFSATTVMRNLLP